MLGNVFEWCQDRDGTLLASSRGTYSDRIITTEGVNRQTNRILRGGMFASQAPEVRSASRVPDVPSLQTTYIGFRVARTMKPKR